jgi:hypothetical protein
LTGRRADALIEAMRRTIAAAACVLLVACVFHRGPSSSNVLGHPQREQPPDPPKFGQGTAGVPELDDFLPGQRIYGLPALPPPEDEKRRDPGAGEPTPASGQPVAPAAPQGAPFVIAAPPSQQPPAALSAPPRAGSSAP